jgi:hypothetical protein
LISSIAIERQTIDEIENEVNNFKKLKKIPHKAFKIFDPKAQVKSLPIKSLPYSNFPDDLVSQLALRALKLLDGNAVPQVPNFNMIPSESKVRPAETTAKSNDILRINQSMSNIAVEAGHEILMPKRMIKSSRKQGLQLQKQD